MSIYIWNVDATNLPAGLFADFLRVAGRNLIATPGALQVHGRGVDLTQVTCDSYVVGGLTDHITPWEGCHASRALLGGNSEFVMCASGHIQTLVCPPGNAKAKRAKHDPLPGQLTLFTSLIEGELREAISLRHRLEKLAELSTPDAVAEKAWLAQDSDDALRRVKRIADVIVGAFFAHGKDKDRLAELQRRKDRVDHWLATRDIEPPAEIVEWQRALHEKVNVFHWPLEFPEVFWPGRPDPLDGRKTEEPACFDAFVGNPPFMGGKTISTNCGVEYSSWLSVQSETSQNVDLAAFFFRRAASLLGRHGVVAFISTNTISQGETKVGGLERLIAQGASIYDATVDLPWPGAAAVTVSVVHVALGQPRGSRLGSKCSADARLPKLMLKAVR